MGAGLQSSANKTLSGYSKFLKYSNEADELLAAINDTFPFKKSWEFLDIGAGNGKITIPLAKKVKTTIVVEPSSVMMNLLKKRLKNKNIVFIKKKIEDFKSKKKFDFILISHTLYFVKNWTKILKKVISLLKKEGYLAIILHAKSGQYYRFLNKFQGCIDNKIKHENFTQAEDILIKLGFSPKRNIVQYEIGIPNFKEMIKMSNFFFGKPFEEIDCDVKKRIISYVKRFRTGHKFVLTANDGLLLIRK